MFWWVIAVACDAQCTTSRYTLFLCHGWQKYFIPIMLDNIATSKSLLDEQIIIIFFPASSGIWKDLGWLGNLSKKCQDGNYVWRLRRPGCWCCDARPGEAATLGTSPSLPGGGAAAARNTKNGYTLHSQQQYRHTTLLSTHHIYSLYTTISTLLDIFSNAHSSVMLRY